MRLFWNLTDDTINTSLDYIGAVGQMKNDVLMKAGQGEPIELQFHRDRVPERLAVGTAVLLGVKKPGDFDGAYLTKADVWTRPGTDAGFYIATLSINTSAIRTALSLDGPADAKPLLGALAEAQYLLVDADLPAKARTFGITLVPHVNQGTEATPAEAAPPYPPPEELIRLLPAVTGYTGGDAAKLDGIATRGQQLDVVEFVHPVDGLQTYRLTASTDATSAPGTIQPTDYDEAENPNVWKLISRAATPEAAQRDAFIRFLPGVSGVSGGGSTKLDGMVTVDQTNLLAVAFRDTTRGLLTYRLTAGTDAESAPGVIRPDDFDATTNPNVWKLLTVIPVLGAPPNDGFAYGVRNNTWVRVALL